MLKVKDSGQFKKDYKRCVKRGLNMNLLKSVVATCILQKNRTYNCIIRTARGEWCDTRKSILQKGMGSGRIKRWKA